MTAPHKEGAAIQELLCGELEQLLRTAGERGYRARQVMHWLWSKEAAGFDDMINLPAALRVYLKQHFTFSRMSAARIEQAADATRKLLFMLDDREAIESVIIPSGRRATLCISTQVGCAMDCAFCATALMKLRRNLTTAEIVGQIEAARGELSTGEELTNYVFMGMGEPLANYPRLKRALAIMTAPWGMNISPRRITVSTVGLVPVMERLLAESRVKLAVSLHATTNELRDRLAPINKRYPLEVLLEACAKLPIARRDRLTFEYVMLRGVNDGAADAARLVRLLAPLRAKVNLILFNSFPGAPFECSTRDQVERFHSILRTSNLTVTIRQSRGSDIAAACGQLSVEHGKSEPVSDESASSQTTRRESGGAVAADRA